MENHKTACPHGAGRNDIVDTDGADPDLLRALAAGLVRPSATGRRVVGPERRVAAPDPRRRPPRTCKPKIIETAQALRLEQVWDKQRILAEYLNRVDYGNYNRGCAAAAQYYFAKPPRDLSTRSE